MIKYNVFMLCQAGGRFICTGMAGEIRGSTFLIQDREFGFDLVFGAEAIVLVLQFVHRV